ncbi:MAG: putative Holliday junction resolvase [Saprospiraceae bacterium]|jgi:putative Holliday junction resolvase
MVTETLLAIDYGTKRVGLAVGNTLTMTTQPLPPITNLQGKLDWLKLNAIIKEWRVKKLILGQPLNQQGEETEMSIKIRKLGTLMETKTLLSVAYADERYSSSEADRTIRSTLQAGKRLSKSKILMRDSLAAELIMQAYFEQN